MIDAQLEIIIIACITAIACAIPGTFLVLRKMTMLADAISHSILLGIVLAFFLVKRIDSPFLILAAAATGILTVLLVETLLKTRLVKEDAAIGVVYPLMFSIAVILISLFASHVHIDTDSVLLGELAFAPLNRLVIGGTDIGPAAYYQIGSIMVVNLILVILFYKEVRLAVFDEGYASTLGFTPKRILYGLMVVTSVTTVAAFEVAGAIMVVGFIVGPAVVASFYTRQLWLLLVLACIIGIAASLSGYSVAHMFDVSIAGTIVSMIGLLFALSLFFAPGTGLISSVLRRKHQKVEFSVTLLVVHLLHHEILGDAEEENMQWSIPCHFNWGDDYTKLIIAKALEYEYIVVESDGAIILTDQGRMMAEKSMNT